jgi:hypothetical protein
VLAAQAKAVIEARYVMAERHPRDLDVVREKLLKECRRPGFAQDARYKISNRGEGFSIRFAEAAIRLMGNISVEQMTIYDDNEKRMVRVTVADCESNIAYFGDISIKKTVERKTHRDADEVIGMRQNRKGETLYIIVATEEEIFSKTNALISKAIRTNGLRLVPKDITDECEQQCAETMRQKDAKDPDAARRNIFDTFTQIGIAPDQLKTYLGHDAAVLTPKELQDLRALFRGIRDGETTWREIMDERFPNKQPESTSKGTEAVKAKLKKQEEIWPKRAKSDDEKTK